MKIRHKLTATLLLLLPSLHCASETVGFEKRVISGRLVPVAVERSKAAPEAAAVATVPDYEWWYGCSPTAAGMLVGYYDIHGYLGENYPNLVPNAVAELSTFPSVEGSWDYRVQRIIASQRHVSDFYSGGYLASGDDLVGAPTGPLDSLADFMGTSQDVYANINGGTTFWFFSDGSRLTVADLYNSGNPDVYQNSGAFGIYEYLRWAGYGDASPQAVRYIYNQYVDTLGGVYGFSLADYRAEINAGRVVLLHLENHSMLGYGYDYLTGELLVHDTASPGEHRMRWGGTYYGYPLIGVSVVDLTGIPGDAPVSTPVITPIIEYLLLDES
jgi:hypothetical protein